MVLVFWFHALLTDDFCPCVWFRPPFGWVNHPDGCFVDARWGKEDGAVHSFWFSSLKQSGGSFRSLVLRVWCIFCLQRGWFPRGGGGGSFSWLHEARRAVIDSAMAFLLPSFLFFSPICFLLLSSAPCSTHVCIADRRHGCFRSGSLLVLVAPPPAPAFLDDFGPAAHFDHDRSAVAAGASCVGPLG